MGDSKRLAEKIIAALPRIIGTGVSKYATRGSLSP